MTYESDYGLESDLYYVLRTDTNHGLEEGFWDYHIMRELATLWTLDVPRIAIYQELLSEFKEDK